MLQSFDYPHVAWPNSLDFKQRGDIGEALTDIADTDFLMQRDAFAGSLMSLATVNGGEFNEAKTMLNNAIVTSLRRLPDERLARVKPAHIEPLASSAMTIANNIALKYPIQILPAQVTYDLTHVESVGHAKAVFRNIREHDVHLDPIEHDDEGVKKLGLTDQKFQPFFWLFVEKDPVDQMDKLLRIYNPMKITLLSAVEQALKEQLAPVTQSKPTIWGQISKLWS